MGNRATVHLTLRLKNGEVRSEKERLVRTPRGWPFGDPTDCDDMRDSGGLLRCPTRACSGRRCAPPLNRQVVSPSKQQSFERFNSNEESANEVRDELVRTPAGFAH